MQTFTNPAGYEEADNDEDDPNFVDFMRQYGVDIKTSLLSEPMGFPAYVKDPVALWLNRFCPIDERSAQAPIVNYAGDQYGGDQQPRIHS